MLRENTAHAMDWCEKTMSMMREKQFEACERRLTALPPRGAFSPDATDLDAQRLWEGSFYASEANGATPLITLSHLRGRVLDQLPMEARFVSEGEEQLLDRLFLQHGRVELSDWDDPGAAEALVSRLWCSFHAEGDAWSLRLEDELSDRLLAAMNDDKAKAAREKLRRFDSTIQGLLYIAGFLHSAQPMASFLEAVAERDDAQCRMLGRRYFKAAFEYIEDSEGALILLHPGLADPYRLMLSLAGTGTFCLELTADVVAGGVYGLLPEEMELHEKMTGALIGATRPEYDPAEAAEDLRMLAKQGVTYAEMESVMSSMLCVLPSQTMKDALYQLYCRTPHWVGLRANRQH